MGQQPQDAFVSTEDKFQSSHGSGYNALRGFGDSDLATLQAPSHRMSASRERMARALPFDPVDTSGSAGVHFGRLREVWQGICREHHFVEEKARASGCAEPPVVHDEDDEADSLSSTGLHA